MHFHIRSVTNFSTYLDGDWQEITRISGRRGRLPHSPIFLDDMSIPARKLLRVNGYIQLCESLQVEYLNLLDYQKKDGDFHSTSTGVRYTVDRVHNFSEVQERLSKRCCTNIFIAFLQYIKDVSVYIEDVSGLCEQIANATTNCVRNCDVEHFRLIFIRAMRIYLDFQLHQGPLLVTLLEHLCFRLELKYLAVECLFLRGAKANFLRKVLHAANRKRFDFWTLWERKFSPSDTINSCPVTMAYLSGKFDNLLAFLEFGFRQTRQRLFTMQEFFHNGTYNIHNYDRCYIKFLPEENLDSRSTVVDEVVLFLCLLLTTDPEHKERLVRCFQLLWSAMKDPFVTKDELLDAFNMKCAEHQFQEESRQQFLEGLASYEKFLENVDSLVRQPRTLQHLCRYTIRDVLNDNWEMPYGVEKLPLPKALKSYILLKTTKRPSVPEWDNTTWIPWARRFHMR